MSENGINDDDFDLQWLMKYTLSTPSRRENMLMFMIFFTSADYI